MYSKLYIPHMKVLNAMYNAYECTQCYVYHIRRYSMFCIAHMNVLNVMHITYEGTQCSA